MRVWSLSHFVSYSLGLARQGPRQRIESSVGCCIVAPASDLELALGSRRAICRALRPSYSLSALFETCALCLQQNASPVPSSAHRTWSQ